MDWDNDLSWTAMEIEIHDDWLVEKPEVNETIISSSSLDKEIQGSFPPLSGRPQYVLKGFERDNQSVGLTLLARAGSLSKTPDSIVSRMETQNRDAAQSIIDCWIVESELRELFMNPDTPL